MTIPTEEAWQYFSTHVEAIRDVCASFLPVKRLEIPNTRVTDFLGNPVLREDTGEEQRGSIKLETSYTIEDFDKAVKILVFEEKEEIRTKAALTLSSIMNRAWLGAPESTGVYRVPGFTEMCNLLDETIPGWLGGNPVLYCNNFEEDEPAF